MAAVVKALFSSASVYEVKKYHYALSGHVVAEMEVYAPAGNLYGGRAQMVLSGETLYVREIYPTPEAALDALIAEVEKSLRKTFDM